jgi:hypothetical protein
LARRTVMRLPSPFLSEDTLTGRGVRESRLEAQITPRPADAVSRVHAKKKCSPTMMTSNTPFLPMHA